MEIAELDKLLKEDVEPVVVIDEEKQKRHRVIKTSITELIELLTSDGVDDEENILSDYDECSVTLLALSELLARTKYLSGNTVSEGNLIKIMKLKSRLDVYANKLIDQKNVKVSSLVSSSILMIDNINDIAAGNKPIQKTVDKKIKRGSNVVDLFVSKILNYKKNNGNNPLIRLDKFNGMMSVKQVRDIVVESKNKLMTKKVLIGEVLYEVDGEYIEKEYDKKVDWDTAFIEIIPSLYSENGEETNRHLILKSMGFSVSTIGDMTRSVG